MPKTILVTGSTDGIGLETARMLVFLGHNVLLHRRNQVKLDNVESSLSDEFAAASGRYYDNDIGQFSSPHPDALNPQKCTEIVRAIEKLLPEIKRFPKSETYPIYPDEE